MPLAAILSFRLGGGDGVSIEAAKWAWALGQLGFTVRTVAGAGPVDVLVPGLAIGAAPAPAPATIAEAVAGADLVVVENLLSLPLNPPAAEVVAAVLRQRPAVLHHHDLPWQRPHLAHLAGPPDDPAWAHVVINERSRLELADRDIEAVTCYNRFWTDGPPGDGERVRASLALEGRVLLHPTRALPRKNVPAALRLAEVTGATYWLVGPAEDGYEEELRELLAGARCPVVHAPLPRGTTMPDAYAAADAVALPSTWEGFGNPTIESAVHRRPLAIGAYPVAEELAAFGFRWFRADEPDQLAGWLDEPDLAVLEHNHAVAAAHFDLGRLPAELADVVERVLP